jgi:hypothetical protein
MVTKKWLGRHLTTIQLVTKIGSIIIKHVATKISVAFGCHETVSQLATENFQSPTKQSLVGEQKISVASKLEEWGLNFFGH